MDLEKQLEQQHEDIKEIRKELHDMHLEMVREITNLKAKSAMWGSIAGLIPAGIFALIQFFIK